MPRRRPKRRWYQFGSHTVLILVVLASVGLGWYAAKMEWARRQREAVEAIKKLGGRVLYDEQSPDRPIVQVDFLGAEEPRRPSDEPYLLVFGPEEPRAKVTDTDLVHLERLTGYWPPRGKNYSWPDGQRCW